MGKNFYLTKNGLKKLEKEYQSLKKLRFSKINDEIPKILHSEDVNPEYLSFKEDLSLIEKRIQEIENILKNVKIITSPPKSKQDVIDLGAKVTVEIDGSVDEFEIVGTLEANPILGKISNESPIGKALLSHRMGDEIIISSPIEIIYKIKKVKY
jgi:transcription elongation factor GreA